MKRITLLLTVGALAGIAALAASRTETTTYIDGNLTNVSPNTGGTLLLSDDGSLYLKTASATVSVPYENVSKVELGATKIHSHDVPLYKVWSLHKRFTDKTKTQYLTVGFKTVEGADQSMTLELAQSSAPDVVATLQSHTAPGVTAVRTGGKAASAKSATAANSSNSEWWGDEYWKTGRNADKWSKTVAANSSEK